MSILKAIGQPSLAITKWFYNKPNLSNFILVIILLLMLFSRAAFHSNYDNYTNIQSIPDFIEQEDSQRGKLTVQTLHQYLKDYSSNTSAITKTVLDPNKYLPGNELNRNRFLWFVCFLIADLFFTLFLGIFLLRSIVPKLFEEENIKNKLTTSGKWFFFFFSLAILFDVIENMLLLSGLPSFNLYGIATGIKALFFALLILAWFFNYHALYYKNNSNHLLKSIAASSVSLIIIILVLSLLTMMQQGITLVLDLFTDRLNSILFILFAAFASLLLSHFPTYLYIRFYKADRYQWIWSSRFWIPTIYYIETYDPELTEKEKAERKTGAIFRHFLGTFFLLMMLYAFAFSWNRTSFKVPSAILNQFFIILGFIMLILHIKLYNRKTQIKKAFQSKAKLDEAINQDKNFLSRYLVPMRMYLLLLTISIMMLFGRLFLTEWSFVNKVFTLIQLSILTFLYIIYREYRSLFKYRFGLSKRFSQQEYSWNFKDDEPILTKKYLIPLDIEKDKRIKEWPRKMHWMGNYSNTVYFLYAIALAGILIPMVIVSNSFTSNISEINGANYLLLFILLFYAIFIAIIKATFYGENKTLKNLFIPRPGGEHKVRKEIVKEKSLLWIPLRFMGFISILLIGGLLYLFTSGTDLHLLDRLPISENRSSEHSISQSQFVKRFQEKSDSETIFALTAFGGGLKANYNTLKTVEEIQNATDDRFLDNTISMSGVSGGGLGLANYYLMDFYKQQDSVERAPNIEKIGNLDIVAIDLTYVLFHDFWRSLLPSSPKIWSILNKLGLDKDRSKVGMSQYHEIIAPDDPLSEIPYQKVHREIYEDGRHAPTLLMNTTSTKLEYGVASSIESGDFPGAINILKGPTMKRDSYNTLNFYDAVSTVNRFPFLSPAAKIENLGHFVDGGYFENSGILTTLSFLDKISDSKWAPDEKLDLNGDKKKVVIVNLVNSKQHWLNHLLRQEKSLEGRFRIREKNSSETKAVLGTMTGTEMLPNFFVEALENKKPKLDSTFEFVVFHIPFKIYIEDVIKYLDAEPLMLETVQKIIVKNNSTIDSLLMSSKEDFGYDFRQWGAAEPALARKLSKPDRLYQDIMIAKHPFVRDQIDRVRDLCGKE